MVGLRVRSCPMMMPCPVQERGLGMPEQVLSRAAEMAICELVAEPQVRQAVREPFLRRAYVSTGDNHAPLAGL